MISKTLKTIARWVIGLPVAYVALWLVLLVLYVFVLIAGGATGYAYETLFGRKTDNMPKTHLTIYVDEPLLSEGGAVIVAGLPMEENHWHSLPDAPNPADDDSANPKNEEVEAHDQHFGVIVSSPVSYVEFYYPAGGTYTFNLLARDELRDGELQTKQIGTGSGPGRRDASTGEQVAWDDVSTIHVFGNKHQESWTRYARAMPGSPLDDPAIRQRRFKGATVFSLSDAMIGKYMAMPNE